MGAELSIGRRDTLLQYLAGALAVAAGVIHFAVTPEHVAEALLFGLFMAVVGVAQVAAGVLIAVRPSRALLLATLLGTVALFVIFAVAYTVGLPVGPHAGEREELGLMVTLSKLTELALVAVIAALLIDTDGPSHQDASVQRDRS